jgi:hypothetical protein
VKRGNGFRNYPRRSPENELIGSKFHRSYRLFSPRSLPNKEVIPPLKEKGKRQHPLTFIYMSPNMVAFINIYVRKANE